MDDSIQDVKIENGSLEIDDDLLSYRDGIYVLVYRENNFIVTGSLPAGITEEIPFISDQGADRGEQREGVLCIRSSDQR